MKRGTPLRAPHEASAPEREKRKPADLLRRSRRSRGERRSDLASCDTPTHSVQPIGESPDKVLGLRPAAALLRDSDQIGLVVGAGGLAQLTGKWDRSEHLA